MSQSVLSVRVDNDDKKSFETFCNSVGMNVSVAVNMFIKAVLREQKLPFEIKSKKEDYDPFYSEENLARLRKSMNRMKETGGTIHEVLFDD